MSKKKLKVIFDADCGSDDAAALICAALSGEFDILGITTVWGSDSVEDTTEHTLMTAELAGIDAPVFKGCGEPLARDIYDKGKPVGGLLRVNGEQTRKKGFHDVFNLPKPSRKASDSHAVTWLIETLRETAEPITIVATGALTNLACALCIAPDITRGIERIVIMGGGVNITNKTMAAEGNFWRDPEAAQTVLESGAAILLVTLDMTHGTAIDQSLCRRIESVGTPTSNFFARIIKTRMDAYNRLQPLGIKDVAVIHDLVCVMLLLDAEIAREYRKASAAISLDHGLTAGMLVVDKRFQHGEENVTLALNADAARFASVLLRLLESAE